MSDSLVGIVTKIRAERNWVKIAVGEKNLSLLQESKFILRGPNQPPSQRVAEFLPEVKAAGA